MNKLRYGDIYQFRELRANNKKAYPDLVDKSQKKAYDNVKYQFDNYERDYNYQKILYTSGAIKIDILKDTARTIAATFETPQVDEIQTIDRKDIIKYYNGALRVLLIAQPVISNTESIVLVEEGDLTDQYNLKRGDNRPFFSPYNIVLDQIIVALYDKFASKYEDDIFGIRDKVV